MLRFINVIIFATLLSACNQVKTPVAGQLSGLDDMLAEHPKTVLDSLKTIEVTRLSKPDRAYYYLLQASAIDKNHLKITEDSLLRISEVYYKNAQDFHNLARTQYYLAKCLNYQRDQEAAYDLMKQAEVSISQSNKEDAHLEGMIYFQLALMQKQHINIEESEIYYKKSFDKFSETQDTVLAVHALTQLGQVYIRKKETDKAKDALTESLNLISQINDKQSKTVIEAKAGTLSTISILYRKGSDLPHALEYAKKSIHAFEEADIVPLSQYYFNLIHAYNNQNDSTRFYCEKMLSRAKEENDLINLINGHKILFRLEEQEGNHEEANRLKDQYIILKDTLNLKTKSEKILELEKKYDLEKKQKLIYKAENKALWLTIFIIVAISAVTIVGLHFLYRHRKLKAELEELSKEVKKTKWGFSVSKELISDNHNTYEELEKILDRNRVHSNNPKLYNDFQEVFKAQKSSYSTHLLATLTDFDNAFIQKIQKQYPDLTPEDVMMAAMMRHQWSTLDISAVFHSSNDAVRKRKSRLKNKILGKESTPLELEEFLISM